MLSCTRCLHLLCVWYDQCLGYCFYIYPPPTCFCPQPFIWTNNMHWASFLLHIRFTIKLRIISRNVSGFAMVLLMVFRAANEPLASCFVWWSGFRLRFLKMSFAVKVWYSREEFPINFLPFCSACYFSSDYPYFSLWRYFLYSVLCTTIFHRHILDSF